MTAFFTAKGFNLFCNLGLYLILGCHGKALGSLGLSGVGSRDMRNSSSSGLSPPPPSSTKESSRSLGVSPSGNSSKLKLSRGPLTS